MAGPTHKGAACAFSYDYKFCNFSFGQKRRLQRRRKSLILLGLKELYFNISLFVRVYLQSKANIEIQLFRQFWILVKLTLISISAKLSKQQRVAIPGLVRGTMVTGTRGRGDCKFSIG